ncbi:MAG: ArsA family ATPase, partial [Proteobacteria bacterium]|nr:ArsA family ATPase [Pseudomonadota bacterium]
SGDFDLCIVDCAPTGSTLRLVTLPEIASRTLRLLLRVQRAVAAVVSPVARVVVPVPLPGSDVFRDIDQLLYKRLATLREMLLSADTSVRIVVTPERMVIDEALRAHTDLALFELRCDAVVMNRLFPPAAAAEAFFEGWGRWQEERLIEVNELFAPLPVLQAELAPDEVVGASALAAHGALIFAGADARRARARRREARRGRPHRAPRDAALMRVVLLTGKGGVGKTTLSAATAIGAADHGHRVFLLSTDPAHSVGDALGRPVGSRPIEVAPNLVAQEVAVLDELDRSWSAIQDWLRQLLRDGADELLAEEVLVFPGLEELVALRAIREVEALGDFDVCVVDCAPTGSTLRMLRFPDALAVFMGGLFDLERRAARALRPILGAIGMRGLVPSDEVFAAFERLVRDVDDVRQILLDGDRTSARLVTNASRVVVDETRRSFAYLCLYGVATDAVLVNRLLPAVARDGFFAKWVAREHEEMQSLEASFGVPLLRAQLRAAEPIGVDALRALSREVYGERDPAAILHRGRPLRWRRVGAATLLEIDLPNVSKEEIEVTVHGDDLHLRVRDARRVIALPASLVGRRLTSATLRNDLLEVRFAR